MASMPWRFVARAASIALLLWAGSALAEPTFPVLTGRVVDDANLLSASDKAELTAELKALEEKSSDQVVVVTLPSLQGYTIEDYGYQLGRHWGIGTKPLNNGVLLIVAPNDRKVRIEVGRGKGGVDVAVLEHALVYGVVGSDDRVEHGVERVVVDVDELRSVLREVAVACDDDGDRLADVPDRVDRGGVLRGAAVDPGGERT